MYVGRTQSDGYRRRRVTGAQISALSVANKGLSVPKNIRVLRPTALRPFDVPNPSKAGGEWTVDWQRAYADAEKVLNAIDFSKQDIVIWVPGTSNHGPHKKFEEAVQDAYQGNGNSLVALQYEASWQLRRSLPTGIATLRLVLEGIRKRQGNHRVLVSGESQGAWIIGEVMADPEASKLVQRAVLLGHPWLAAHQYDRGQDKRVQVINHEGDQVTLPVKGNPTDGLDAMLAIRTLDLSKTGSLLKALAANPDHGVKLLTSIAYAIPFLKTVLKNPHVYDAEMVSAVEFLRSGEMKKHRRLQTYSSFIPQLRAA